LLSAVTKPASDNIERILTEYDLNQQGIYLPTENNAGLFSKLKAKAKPDSVLVFMPEKSNVSLEDINPPKTKKIDGLYLTPPGQALCEMFEKRRRKSFSTMDLQKFARIMPTIISKELKFADTINFQINENVVKVEINKSIFDYVCQETNNRPKTHKQVGCLLTSAIACALAKATSKPITIKNEIFDAATRKTLIEYQIMINMKD
jgi:hypothetical protein